MTLKGRRSKWKGHKLKYWGRVCLRCSQNKRMLRGNYICDDCKRAHNGQYSKIWDSEIYNV